MNTHFVKYEPSTGRIVWAGYTQIDAVAADHDVVLTDAAVDPSCSRVVDGKVVALPPRPSGPYKFDYAAGLWVVDHDAAAAAVKGHRLALLADSDWTQLPDVPLDTKAAWAEYRQALRDITEQPGYPFDIVWPTPPQ